MQLVYMLDMAHGNLAVVARATTGLSPRTTVSPILPCIRPPGIDAGASRPWRLVLPGVRGHRRPALEHHQQLSIDLAGKKEHFGYRPLSASGYLSTRPERRVTTRLNIIADVFVFSSLSMYRLCIF